MIWLDWLTKIVMKKDPILEIDPRTGDMDKRGNLYQLLNNYISAYNHRTTVLVGTSSPKLDAIIEMLRAQAGVAAELALVKDELSIIHGLVQGLSNPPSTSKPLEVIFVFKVPNNHQDEPFSISIGAVTDAEGETLPDASGLTVEVTSSDDAVVGVSFDSATKSGVASFGHSGVASLNATVKNAAGEILGSGAANFTVTTGDPAAVSDVSIAFSGITEETETPPEG